MAMKTLHPVVDGKKQCSKCSATKPVSAFPFNKKKNRPTAQCKACEAEKVNEYRRANPDIIKARKKKAYDKDPAKHYQKSSAWKKLNRDRVNAKSRENRERLGEMVRIKDIAWRYNLPEPEYRAIIERQGGKRCAICGVDRSGKRGLHIDHCHDTGFVRGILCGKCNGGIGFFKHDTKLLEAAIAYLNESRQRMEEAG